MNEEDFKNFEIICHQKIKVLDKIELNLQNLLINGNEIQIGTPINQPKLVYMKFLPPYLSNNFNTVFRILFATDDELKKFVRYVKTWNVKRKHVVRFSFFSKDEKTILSSSDLSFSFDFSDKTEFFIF